MFGAKSKVKEADTLMDELRRKISEIHLKIRSGTLSEEELRLAEEMLQGLQRQVRSQTSRVCCKKEEGEPTP